MNRADPLETAHDAILDALEALGRVDPTQAHQPARTALERAKTGLFEAACAVDLARLALESTGGPTSHA